jgi:hypothetical protein
MYFSYGAIDDWEVIDPHFALRFAIQAGILAT